jgi:phage-related minor tail protein
MALEPSGISLQAKGFKDYVKNLDTIEKKQREAFDTEFEGTSKSFAQVTKAAKAYEKELAAVAAAEKKAQQEAEKLAQAQVKAAETARTAQKKQAKEAERSRRAGRTQVGEGVRAIATGDISGGLKNVVGGLKAIGPAAAIATGGLAAVAAGAVVVTTAVGAIGVSVINLAKDTDTATRQIGAGLGITAAQAADKYNKSVQNIFKDNPQAQFGEIAQAITLTERALDGLTDKQLENIAGQAIKISDQFDQDLPKVIGAFEQSMEQLGLTGDQAGDFITASLQRLPVDDAIDSINEYSGTLADMGFAGDEAFSLLLGGAQGAILGTDRAIDAINEFNIRFVEGGDDIKESFATLGLNFDEFRQAAEQGTGTAADAFKAFIQRAGEVDLSITSNRAAVNALGTQFEQLSADTIKALDPDAIGFEDVAGAADKLDERFDTLGGAFQQIRAGALVALAPIGKVVLDLANSIVPKIKAAFEAVRPAIEAFAARVVPAFEFGAAALGRLGESLGLARDGASTFESVLNGVAVVIEGVAGGIEILARVTETFRQIFAFARAGAAAFGSIISDVFSTAIKSIGALGAAFLKLVKLDFAGAGEALKDFEIIGIDDVNKSLDKAGQAAISKFKEIAVDVEEIPIEPVIVPEVEIPAGIDTGLAKPFIEQTQAIKLSEEALESYQGALKQAEDLQRSFSREAEDSALKLIRANEDIARSQAKAEKDLGSKQAKDRDKLLGDQIRELDDFEKDRKKQIAKAEADIRQARKAADEKRKQDQAKLQRELKQAQDSFNLSQLQSERRFKLQETRLIAEGDILAIQQLREDQALQRQEEKENFDESQKGRIQSAEETQKEQGKDLESQLSTLKANLEDQKAELLRSFDEQIEQQRIAQAEERTLQQQKFAEDAAERQIQLAREEEDRRISQQRQIEDLGRSLAEQAGVTAEGTAAIAGELEKVFGIDGVADSIMTGFTEKTENEFTDLFANLEKTASESSLKKILQEVQETALPGTLRPSPSSGGGGFGSRIGGIPEFGEGGVVPGPVGSPQIIQAHGGETIFPTQQRSFQMIAPVIPSQSLEVLMSGGFNITGDGQSNEAILQAATQEMTENFRIAVRRLARRNN